MTDDEIAEWSRFMGYGSPASRVWFMGFEEGGNPETTLPCAIPVPGCDGLLFSRGVDSASHTNVWSAAFRISEALRGNGFDPRTRQPRFENMFVTNVRPLPRPRTACPGLTPAQWESERPKRKENFSRMQKRFKPRIVFVHGKGIWADARAFFDVDVKQVEAHDFFEFHEASDAMKAHLIFSPYFGNGHMSIDRQERLVKFVTDKGWL